MQLRASISELYFGQASGSTSYTFCTCGELSMHKHTQSRTINLAQLLLACFFETISTGFFSGVSEVGTSFPMPKPNFSRLPSCLVLPLLLLEYNPRFGSPQVLSDEMPALS